MSLLWELTSQSGSVSYLYGTMHLQNDSAYTFINAVKDIILSKPRFYGETDIDGLRNDSRLSYHYLLKNNKVLADFVGENKYKKWKSRVRKHYDTDLDRLQRFIPFYIYNNLQISLLPKSNRIPLDGFLWDFAKANDRQVLGLESIDHQMKTLSDIPLEFQIKQLKAFLQMPNRSKKRVEYLSQHYANQNIHRLYAVSKKDIGGLRNLMLYSRNQRMVNTIVSSIETPAVYTFGAAHLSGQKGMIHLLKKHGYSLKPVKI